MELIELAKSKINLSLNLSGKKANGFHDLISFICFGSFSDKLILKRSKKFSYKVNSSLNDAHLKDDLVIRVVHKIKKEYYLEELPKIDLILQKNIPIGAGLGGGSADAAATIRLMNKFLDLGMSQDEMCHFGKDLGSDIPACIVSRPIIAYGRGEKLLKVDFKKSYHMLIIYPKIEIHTKEIFSLIGSIQKKDLDTKKVKKTIELLSGGLKNNILESFDNDLQDYAFKAYPSLVDVINILNINNSFFSRMTGSGSACFGLFESKFIDKAFDSIKKEHPEWLIEKTLLNDL